MRWGKIQGHYAGKRESAAEFDELQLVLWTPRGLLVFVHDGRAGVSKHGKRTEPRGYTIAFEATIAHEHEECLDGERFFQLYSEALEIIVEKMKGRGCTLIATVEHSDT